MQAPAMQLSLELMNMHVAHLHLGGVVEVGGADSLAHEVPVGARALHGHLLLLHDVPQLLPHLLRLAQHCTRGCCCQTKVWLGCKPHGCRSTGLCQLASRCRATAAATLLCRSGVRSAPSMQSVPKQVQAASCKGRQSSAPHTELSLRYKAWLKQAAPLACRGWLQHQSSLHFLLMSDCCSSLLLRPRHQHSLNNISHAELSRTLGLQEVAGAPLSPVLQHQSFAHTSC